MYRFIIGGSGSGKTYRAFGDCISSSLENENSRFLLIVPEQATTETEREIVRRHPGHATDTIDVLSFQRLAYRVFAELGIENPTVLDDISKAMILRRIAQEKEPELLAWKGRFDKVGFIDNLKSMISEMIQYGTGEIPVADSYPKRLKNKLHDLNLLYRSFREYIEGEFITPEDIPDILSRNLCRSLLLRDAVIVLDGFTGFTPVQYRIIESFLVYAREVVITVSMGGDSSHELFAMGRTILNRITDLASRNGIPHGQDTHLTTDSFLEKHLLRYDGTAPAEGNGGIRLVRAKNIAEEAQFTAGDIERRICGLSLHLHPEAERNRETEQQPIAENAPGIVPEETPAVDRRPQLRYRDIAVVSADMETYRDDIEHEFRMAGIPYYSDRTIGLTDNVLTQMILAALDIISSDYSYESVVRYLKTGLVTDDTRMIDLCDNYMFAYGRRGYRRMRGDWNPAAEICPELPAFKDAVMDGLELMRNNDPAPGIRALCEHLHVAEKLEAMCRHFAQTGDAPREREYSMAYESIMQILDRMETILENEQLSAREFAGIFSAGIAQKKLGMIPSGVDRVTVGDLTRTRLEHIRVLYVLGANDGRIPKLLNRNSVITDTEKRILKESGIELSPTVKEDLSIQRYYLYRVLTKPEEQLTVTFAGMDQNGAGMQESYLIPHLQSLFRNLPVEHTGDELKIGHARERMKHLQLIRKAEHFRHLPERLTAESVNSIYGEELYSSISRLERYSECPYHYFLQYGLELKELKKFSFEAVDIGNLAHAALEKVFTAVKKNNEELAQLSDEKRDEYVSEAIRQAVLDDRSAKYYDTSRSAYLVRRLERVVRRSLWGIAKNLREEDMIPYAFEQEFDSVHLPLENGRSMTLYGKIDRIDLAKNRIPEIRIVDYKTGSKSWDWNEVLNSHDLQLSLYMTAAKQLIEERFGQESLAREMYYYHIEDPMIEMTEYEPDDAKYEEAVETQILRKLEPSGLNQPAQIRKAMETAEKNAQKLAGRIYEGDIAVSPRTKAQGSSCDYCAYRMVCGFDTRLKGFDYRKEHKYSKEELQQILREDSNKTEAEESKSER